MTWEGRSSKMCVPEDGVCYEYHEFRCGGNPGGICFEEPDCPVTHDEIHNEHCKCFICETNRKINCKFGRRYHEKT